jgi:hypothetical protein
MLLLNAWIICECVFTSVRTHMHTYIHTYICTYVHGVFMLMELHKAHDTLYDTAFAQRVSRTSLKFTRRMRCSRKGRDAYQTSYGSSNPMVHLDLWRMRYAHNKNPFVCIYVPQARASHKQGKWCCGRILLSTIHMCVCVCVRVCVCVCVKNDNSSCAQYPKLSC